MRSLQAMAMEVHRIGGIGHAKAIISHEARLQSRVRAYRRIIPAIPPASKSIRRAPRFTHRSLTTNRTASPAAGSGSTFHLIAVCASDSRQSPYESDYDDSPGTIFLEILKNIYLDLQYCVMFLLEQPGELKYIEFPSLKSATRMALFTIAVVMMLIVLLATIDSGFTYIVAAIFRRT